MVDNEPRRRAYFFKRQHLLASIQRTRKTNPRQRWHQRPKKADKELKKRVGAILNGIHRDDCKVTYASMRESYYADYEINGRKSLRRDKEANPHMDKVVRLDSFFTGYRADEIDTELIRKFIADQQAKGLSNGSINRSLSALRRMFNIAVEDGTLRHKPHFPMLAESAPRQGFLGREQYETLAECLPDYLRLPLAIAYFSAMRLGEVLQLNWKQVDFLAGEIRLLAGKTKNNEGRVVPIIPALRSLLKEQFARRQPACPFVCFRLDAKGHAVKINSFTKAWRTACVKAGFGEMVPVVDAEGTATLAKQRTDRPRSKPKAKMIYEGTIFHDLRRSGARNLVNAGVPEKIAMQIGGWKTRSVFDRYNIVDQKNIADAGKKLAAFLDEKRDNSGTICTNVVQSVLLTN
jgi:integrase